MLIRNSKVSLLFASLLTLLIASQAYGKKIDLTPYVDNALTKIQKAIDSEVKKSAKKFDAWENNFLEKVKFTGASVGVEVLSKTKIEDLSYNTATETVNITFSETVKATGIAKWSVLGKSDEAKSNPHSGKATIICTYEKGAWHVRAVLSIAGVDLKISEEAIQKLLAEDYEGGLEDIISDNVTRVTYSNYDRLVEQASKEYGYTTYDHTDHGKKNVRNYYFVSFDFVKWASPRTALRWIVGSYMTDGAYAEKIEAEVEVNVEREAEAFWKWLELHAKYLYEDAKNDAILRFQQATSGKEVLAAFLKTRDQEKRRVKLLGNKQIRFKWQAVQFYNRVLLGGEPVGPRHLRQNHAGFLIAFVDPDALEKEQLKDDNFDEFDRDGKVVPPSKNPEDGWKNSKPDGSEPEVTLRQWCLVHRYYWDCCNECWIVCYEWIPCCFNSCEYMVSPCQTWEFLHTDGEW